MACDIKHPISSSKLLRTGWCRLPQLIGLYWCAVTGQKSKNFTAQYDERRREKTGSRCLGPSAVFLWDEWSTCQLLKSASLIRKHMAPLWRSCMMENNEKVPVKMEPRAFGLQTH